MVACCKEKLYIYLVWLCGNFPPLLRAHIFRCGLGHFHKAYHSINLSGQQTDECSLRGLLLSQPDQNNGTFCFGKFRQTERAIRMTLCHTDRQENNTPFASGEVPLKRLTRARNQRHLNPQGLSRRRWRDGMEIYSVVEL